MFIDLVDKTLLSNEKFLCPFSFRKMSSCCFVLLGITMLSVTIAAVLLPLPALTLAIGGSVLTLVAGIALLSISLVLAYALWPAKTNNSELSFSLCPETLDQYDDWIQEK